MAHYAKVLNGLVQTVIVAEQEFINSFVDNSPGEWIQTSYNTRGGVHYDPITGEPSADQSKALRKNYASAGYVYNASLDAFVPPKPYTSWILDEETCLWNAPVSLPQDGKTYKWDEETISWIESPLSGTEA
jgi:hypothetical protein